MDANKKNNFCMDKLEYLLSIAAVLCIFLIYLPTKIDSDSIIYGIGQKHAYNKELFASNIFLGSGNLSPRYIMDAFFSFLMRLNGGNWAGVVRLIIAVSTFIMAVAVVNIVYNSCKEARLIQCVLLGFLIVMNGNELAGGESVK